MEFIEYRLKDIFINYDNLRKPLSSMERSTFQGEYPYYGAQGIIDYVKEYRCDGEYLLIAEDGENLNSRNQPIALIAKGKFWVNNHAHIVKTNDLSDIRFACYALNHMDINGYVTGTAQPKLSQKNLNHIKVRFPVKTSQLAIVKILSTYDDLIENNNKRIKLLEQMAENLYKEWFVRFRFPNHENTEFENGIPVGWERTTFEKIASFQNGYAFKSEELLGSSEDDTYEVFKQGHIMRGGGFKAEGTKSWYPKSKCADLNKFILHKNDILMAMTDMKDNVAILGNTALLPHDNRYILNQRVGLLQPTNYRKVGFAYIYLLTNSYDFVNDLRSRANRGVQVNLSAAQIRSSATVVPSEEINEKFEQIINPIFEEVFNILNQNENLIKQRDLLLPRLMSGKLEV